MKINRETLERKLHTKVVFNDRNENGNEFQ